MNGYYEEIILIKEDATPIDNITKFAWADEDYETVEVWHEYTDDELVWQKQAEINELKQNLANTDYIIIKIAEGASTLDEYADTIALRQQWREQINELEAQI